MKLIDADALKYKNLAEVNGRLTYVLTAEEIDNAPTVEPIKQCKYCKHCGNEDYCSNCHSDHSLFEYHERPQGKWLFTEIDENYHVYGQCSVCKERNRIGKACRSCGAEMKGGKE